MAVRIAPQAAAGPNAGGSSVPHRAPGSPGHSEAQLPHRKTHQILPAPGSADVRQLIDGGFQAFNAGRLSEACHIYADKMLAPENDTTIGLTVAGALTPAGLGGCVDRADGARAHRLHHQHRREPLSRPALRAELHAPSRLAVPERRRALRAGHHPHLRRAVPGDRAARDRRLHPRLPRPRRSSRDRSPRPSSTTASASTCSSSSPGCAEYSVVAAAAQAGVPIYTSSPGDSSIGMNIAYHELMNGSTLMIDPNRDVNEVCAIILAGTQERLRDSRRRLAEELLPAGAADALGGLRHSQGRQRLLHPDHDRPGGLGRALGRDAGRSRQLGQGQSRACCPTPSSPTATRRSPFRCSASTPSAPRTTAARARSSCTSATRWSPTCCDRRRRRRSTKSTPHGRAAGRNRQAQIERDVAHRRNEWGRCRQSSAAHVERVQRRAAHLCRRQHPERRSSASCAQRLGGTCCSSSSTTICGARATSSTTGSRGSSAARSSRSIATTSTTAAFRRPRGRRRDRVLGAGRAAPQAAAHTRGPSLFRRQGRGPLPLEGRKVCWPLDAQTWADAPLGIDTWDSAARGVAVDDEGKVLRRARSDGTEAGVRTPANELAAGHRPDAVGVAADTAGAGLGAADGWPVPLICTSGRRGSRRRILDRRGASARAMRCACVIGDRVFAGLLLERRALARRARSRRRRRLVRPQSRRTPGLPQVRQPRR